MSARREHRLRRLERRVDELGRKTDFLSMRVDHNEVRIFEMQRIQTALKSEHGGGAADRVLDAPYTVSAQARPRKGLLQRMKEFFYGA